MAVEVRLASLADGRAVLHVSGDLDLSTRDLLACAVMDALAVTRTDHLLVDLSGTTFLDACGIGSLIRVQVLAGGAGADLSVRGARGMVATVLHITRVDEVLCRPSSVTPAGADGPG
jgi:anti-sigma B factor antagonist